MSESDDTDDLLLIPPDLFAYDLDIAEAYATVPYINVVDSLITQVTRLEDRVNFIEAAEISVHSSLLSVAELIPMETLGSFASSDDLLKSNEQPINLSAYSTPQKPRTRYRLNSLPSTPSTVRKPACSSPNHKKQLLKDIDTYVNNTRSTIGSQPSTDIIEINGKKINLKEIEDILGDIEYQKNKVDDNLKVAQPAKESEQSWNGNRRRLNHLSVVKVPDDKSTSSSSSDLTQIAARRYPENSVQTHNQYNRFEDGDKELENVTILNLKDLWSKNARDAALNMKEKYEEEKLRRKHCEQLIQDLQSKTLELQEKLAVAVNVDQVKSNALLKFHDAWEQISYRLKSLTKERDELEDKIKELEMRANLESAEAAKKITHYEEETVKAINLAHDNHEKLISVEKLNVNLNIQLGTMEEKLKNLEDRFVVEAEKTRKLNEIIAQKELDINEHKHILTDSRKEVSQSKIAIEKCEAELSHMKKQYKQLELLLGDKQTYTKELETQKQSLVYENENLKLQQSNLLDELNKSKDSLEKNKSELRNFYQDQVEAVVREKLKEFQQQLDKAETSLHEEVRNREMAIAKTAASHIQQLSQKHLIEVNLLEEKHKEEVRLYQVQLSQTQQRVEMFQSKINQMNQRRTTVAQQLHKVMEAQWLETVKIINNGRSPVPSQDETMDQLYTLKSKSYSNFEEVLSDKRDNVHDRETLPNVNSSGDNAGYSMEQTPVTSKVPKGRRQVENDMQKYIQLLLNKPMSASKENVSEEKNDTANNERWSFDSSEDGKQKTTTHGKRLSKPPWK